MSHTRIVGIYSTMMFSVASVMGGYVACGAPTYRVPVHGDGGTTSATSSNRPENVAASGDRTMNGGAALVGVHSQAGWSRSGKPIEFYTSVDLSPAVVNQLQKAMESWEKALGKQLFDYKGIEPKRGSDFSTLYQPLNDQINGHYFDLSWSTSTGKSAAVLATTIWENSPSDAQSIVKADIRYNAENYVFGDALNEFGQGKRTIVDLESLALHELGHLLGLSHVSADDDRYSVMNPSLFIGEGMATRKLSRGDIERVRSIYGVGDPGAADELQVADDSDGS